MPNPASGEAFLTAALPTGGSTRVELLDPLGRTISVIDEKSASAGYHRWALPVDELRSGLYLVRLQQGGSTRVVRFTKE